MALELQGVKVILNKRTINQISASLTACLIKVAAFQRLEIMRFYCTCLFKTSSNPGIVNLWSLLVVGEV